MAEESSREAVTRASIQAMKEALEDPATDVAAHALEHSFSIGETEEGDPAAWMVLIPGLPGWMPGGTPRVENDFEISPVAVQLRVQTSARGTISHLDPETGRWDEQPLDEEQQRTVDLYAGRVAFTLQWMANGDMIPDDSAEEDRRLMESDDLAGQHRRLRELIETAEAMSEALLRNAGRTSIHLQGDEENAEVLEMAATVRHVLATARMLNDMVGWTEISPEDLGGGRPGRREVPGTGEAIPNRDGEPPHQGKGGALHEKCRGTPSIPPTDVTVAERPAIDPENVNP